MGTINRWFLSCLVRGGGSGVKPEHLQGDTGQEVGAGPAQLCGAGKSHRVARCYDLHLERLPESGLFPDFPTHKLKIPNKQRGQSFAILQSSSFL